MEGLWYSRRSTEGGGFRGRNDKLHGGMNQYASFLVSFVKSKFEIMSMY